MTSNDHTLATRIFRRLADILANRTIHLVQLSLGLIFFGFGVLKFFPNLSPAAPLVEPTIAALSFGLVPPTAAMIITAVIECFIGFTLITGIWLRAGLVVLGGALLGIMAPLVVLPGLLFDGGITLAAQYVIKDIVLVTAGLVVAAQELGVRLVPAHRRYPTDAQAHEHILTMSTGG